MCVGAGDPQSVHAIGLLPPRACGCCPPLPLGLFVIRQKKNVDRDRAQIMRNIMCLAASLVVACGALSGFAAWAQTALGIDVVSSRPDLVTGGDALVRISGAEAAPAGRRGRR
jgi:hypothetical protein